MAPVPASQVDSTNCRIRSAGDTHKVAAQCAARNRGWIALRGQSDIAVLATSITASSPDAAVGASRSGSRARLTALRVDRLEGATFAAAVPAR
eukprot:2450325-Prymnesium_polylepis.2